MPYWLFVEKNRMRDTVTFVWKGSDETSAP